MCCCLLRTPHWGPGLQPRHRPWPGIEPVIPWFTGQHSIQWTTPARAGENCFRVHLSCLGAKELSVFKHPSHSVFPNRPQFPSSKTENQDKMFSIFVALILWYYWSWKEVSAAPSAQCGCHMCVVSIWLSGLFQPKVIFDTLQFPEHEPRQTVFLLSQYTVRQLWSI